MDDKLGGYKDHGPGDADREQRKLSASEDARNRIARTELQHRVRNMVGIIRSVFTRTVAAGGLLEDVADHFKGRLDVIARHHMAWIMAPESVVTLEMMIYEELLTYQAAQDSRVSLSGPDVRLKPEQAQLLGLAFHELATNSVKFGVLASADSRPRLIIQWVVENATLHVRWRETGISILGSVPLKVGFGREFLEEALPYQLGGTCTVEMRPGELSWIISVPMSQA
jgi:two-component system CheB/CheR fusion protein